MTYNRPYMENLTEESWLLQRKLFITATEASALMGVNPYNTPSKLLKEKPQAPTKLISPYLDRGLENEESVLKMAAQWLGGELLDTQGFYANPDTRISATPDGLLKDGRLIEAKCTGMINLGRWKDLPPIYYIMQCHVQMYVVGAKENYLHARFFHDWPTPECFEGGNRMYKIEYNEEIIKILVDKVAEFWYALDKGKIIRLKKEDREYHTELLASTCTPYKGNIIMQKDRSTYVIDGVQLSIIRQTCLKAAAKMATGLNISAVIELAELIEKEIFYGIGEAAGDNSRNFLIQIGAAVNGYVEGHHQKDSDILDLRDFVIASLKYIVRPVS